VAEVRERGDRELSDQRQRARQDLQGQLPELATGLAERILGRSLSGDHRRTVDDYVGSIDGDQQQGSHEDAGHTPSGPGGTTPATSGSGSRSAGEDG
jgi:hypothetical protein